MDIFFLNKSNVENNIEIILFKRNKIKDLFYIHNFYFLKNNRYIA